MAEPVQTANLHQRPVVAGVDGTDRDDHVVAYAAAEAHRRGVELHLVHARESLAGIGITAETLSLVPASADPSDGVLETAEQAARDAQPGLTVTTDRPIGSAAGALVDASREAGLVVVGSGRRSALETLVLGSVTYSVTAHAHCPVAVVGPEQPAAAGRVVAAVDGSAVSADALAEALWAAHRLGAPLTVVTVWHLAVVQGYVVTEPESVEWSEVVERHHRMLETLVADTLKREAETDPAGATAIAEVQVTYDVLWGATTTALAEASTEADLMVIGSRGHGGFLGQLLGSVSHGLLKRAHCPVLVVHER